MSGETQTTMSDLTGIERCRREGHDWVMTKGGEGGTDSWWRCFRCGDAAKVMLPPKFPGERDETMQPLDLERIRWIAETARGNWAWAMRTDMAGAVALAHCPDHVLRLLDALAAANERVEKAEAARNYHVLKLTDELAAANERAKALRRAWVAFNDPKRSHAERQFAWEYIEVQTAENAELTAAGLPSPAPDNPAPPPQPPAPADPPFVTVYYRCEDCRWHGPVQLIRDSRCTDCGGR